MSARNPFPIPQIPAQVKKEYVVLSDGQVGWILGVGKKSVLARTNDSLMPVGRDPKDLLSKSTDICILGGLSDASPDKAACFDFVEKHFRLTSALV
jgi:hypothetical protein